ncbi:phosphonate ABC transporter ATP-binding protein [Hwanghaeella grinnelliae]|uniref:Phosphonate ABC transporter ATP-binding protein n=1 Tax=Hwanghaeella grinnelliae TaxID=2500179 RepID=A0A3S2XZQ7_9PROT|nr:phosphonate ABC transporter ATP-binding protein [Hwanghaeella grinnelliae]RVU33629.1 phosphonate ABC transporter ATP-binding protein [Hwanghaeella grinnelliae]
MPNIVEVKSVNKRFGRGPVVLNDINLAIEEGEMVALIGASGSGKSTLIRTICGLETADTGVGRISLFGQVTQSGGKRLPAQRQLRSQVGVIFQQFNLVTRLSLLTNVLVGRLGRIPKWRGLLGLFPRSDRITALKALERVGMADKARQRASTLSGGQQQRGAIARALTQEARLILADEPIASLDPASAERVMETLGTINKEDGVTVIVSLHQIDHAFKHCDRIIALKDGAVAYDGTTEGISPENIANLYGVEGLDLVKDARPKDGDGASAEGHAPSYLKPVAVAS